VIPDNVSEKIVTSFQLYKIFAETLNQLNIIYVIFANKFVHRSYLQIRKGRLAIYKETFQVLRYNFKRIADLKPGIWMLTQIYNKILNKITNFSTRHLINIQTNDFYLNDSLLHQKALFIPRTERNA
jgi:hypothetical protein